MKNSLYKKGIVFVIIVLFMGVSYSSAFAVEDKTSTEYLNTDTENENPIKNNVNGPDLKIKTVSLRYGEKGHYWVWYVTCEVINIGDAIVDGHMGIYSEVWRWHYFKPEESLGWVYGTTGGFDWDSGETKTIDGIWEHRYRLGLYRIEFSVSTSGDVNPENDDFKRYFNIIFNTIYPSNPFDAPEEGKIDVLLQTPREKVINNMLLLRLLEQYPLLKEVLLRLIPR